MIRRDDRISLRPLVSIFVTLVFLISISVKGSSEGESTGSAKAISNPDWYNGHYSNQISSYAPAGASSPSLYTASGGNSSPLARDSYTDAQAASQHSGNSGSQGQAIQYHYQMYPGDSSAAPSQSYSSDMSQTYGMNDAYGPSDNSMFSGNSASGSIGLLGLLGLKGLKPLLPLIKPLLLLPILPLLLPFLLLLAAPLLLLLAIPLLLIFLFIPVPVVTVPVTGRLVTTAREMKELALSEDCIERISCEATRFARNYGFNPIWVQEYLEKSSTSAKWMERIFKGIQATDCQKFSCNPTAAFKKSFKMM